jgi:two-component system response regulator ChvI
VAWRGSPVALSVTEFLLLQALVRRPGIVKSRDQLMEEAYPDHVAVSDRTIDSHVKRIRRKFSMVDPTFDGIDGVYGAGYRYRLNPA